jgi:hypothetical protein
MLPEEIQKAIPAYQRELRQNESGANTAQVQRRQQIMQEMFTRFPSTEHFATVAAFTLYPQDLEQYAQSENLSIASRALRALEMHMEYNPINAFLLTSIIVPYGRGARAMLERPLASEELKTAHLRAIRGLMVAGRLCIFSREFDDDQFLQSQRNNSLYGEILTILERTMRGEIPPRASAAALTKQSEQFRDSVPLYHTMIQDAASNALKDLHETRQLIRPLIA